MGFETGATTSTAVGAVANETRRQGHWDLRLEVLRCKVRALNDLARGEKATSDRAVVARDVVKLREGLSRMSQRKQTICEDSKEALTM